MKKFYPFLFVVLACLSSATISAQNPGDTIIVKTLNYNSGVRDTVVNFPTTNLSYEKVYMQYSMRCKNAQVSTGSNRNLGCGEWDYSCNTYLHDSSHVDSVEATHPEYIISGFSGTTFPYLNSPTYDFRQTFQKGVSVTTTISDTASVVGTGTLALSHVLPTDTHAGKSQYIFTQSELLAAGAHAGNIDALSLNLTANPQQAKLFRVRMKATSKSALSDTLPDLTGFTEVYFHQTNFVTGANKIQFSTPFLWDGVSNIIVETSFTNKTNSTPITFSGNTGSGLFTRGDAQFYFNGDNYIEAHSYKGITGGASRTVEAWIKTTVIGKEIVSWGRDAVGEKWLLRLDNSGKLRVEVNSGYQVGSTAVNDGEWHHVVAVQNGSSTSQISLYVDGQLETIATTGVRVINTGSALNVRITKGHHNFMWDGNIAEVRIWSKALSANEIANWRFKKLDNTHPDYSNLELYYPLNEGSGTSISDQSGNNRNATVLGGTDWSQIYGADHFKTWEEVAERPNATFHQGQYALNITTDTILDSVMRSPHMVNQYAVFSKTGTIFSDSIGIINSNNYWGASPQITYSPTGAVVSSSPVTPTATINIANLPYFQRNPSRFEIMSFVTPYGIGIDFGQEGKTWVFDVTDFTPILKGPHRMTIERGGQWQEELDIKFLFVVGTPARDVLDIQQIWKVDKKSFSSISTEASFEPRDVMMNPAGKSFKIRSTITGHGQEGEFIPRNHWINVAGGAIEYNWQVWKECAENPIYPQGGTWIYDRAGWCPGMPTDVNEMDITSHVTAGQLVEIDYGVSSASGTSDYIVNNQLVTYGDPNFTLDAAVVDIISPTNYVEYGRMSTICEGAVIVIQNTGSTPLTALTVNYWINDAPTPQTFSWTGTLNFLETAEVSLPQSADLWKPITGSNDVFHVEVLSPNGGADEYAFNNKMRSVFEIPEVMPNEFYISFRTNTVAHQNSYEIRDEWGTVMISKSGLSNNTTYQDTVNLPFGCYTFRLEDAGDNGISFWANSEGSGSLMFRNTSNNLPVKIFDGDFGDNINYHFTVNSPLTEDEFTDHQAIRVFPNPARDKFTVELGENENAEITIYNGVGQLIQIPFNKDSGSRTFNTNGLAKGVYFIHIDNGSELVIKKVVLL